MTNQTTNKVSFSCQQSLQRPGGNEPPLLVVMVYMWSYDLMLHQGF